MESNKSILKFVETGLKIKRESRDYLGYNDPVLNAKIESYIEVERFIKLGL